MVCIQGFGCNAWLPIAACLTMVAMGMWLAEQVYQEKIDWQTMARRWWLTLFVFAGVFAYLMLYNR